jgi:transposase
LALLRHGLLWGSFIPAKPQRQLRELIRHRTTLVQDRARVINRVQAVLEDANIKLASVVTDIRGISARAMLEALIAGQRDVTALADLARGRLHGPRARGWCPVIPRDGGQRRVPTGQSLSHKTKVL